MKTIKVEIITPDKLFLKEDFEFVVLPGESGELGILPGHSRLFSLLKQGTVRLVSGEITKKYVINSGVAYVEPSTIKILSSIVRPA
jgi:F-type H+-transporting ATPase subunit epsilon